MNDRVNCSVSGIVGRLEQIGDRAVKGVSTALHEYAELMLHAAMMNAPHDTGDLERALHIEAMRNGINGRLWIKITVDPSVHEYAWLMEEFLSPHGRGGPGGYNARAGTIAKGPQAGGKYLDRAMKEYKDALIRRANEMARKAVKR